MGRALCGWLLVGWISSAGNGPQGLMCATEVYFSPFFLSLTPYISIFIAMRSHY